jgi:NTE family protein
LLKDIDARWTALRAIRDSPAFAKGKDPALGWVGNVPNADIYAIEVSFQKLTDKKERDYLNQLPTSFALPAEAVDRLRAAAKKIIFASPELQSVLTASQRDVADRVGKAAGN